MNRKFSIENGFQIVMLFSMLFWWKFLKKVMVNKGLINNQKLTPKEKESASTEDKIKDDLYFKNDFFDLTICNGKSYDRFEKAIEKRLHISPNKQHEGLIVKEKVLFQLAIDLCEQFNDEYYKGCDKNSLKFAISWLEDMLKNPKAHKVEWNLWSQTIIDVMEKGQKSFGFF